MYPASKVTTINGTLREIKGKPRPATPAEKQQFYSMLLHYAYQRGYSRGWAYHKYREKFGVGTGRQIKESVLEPNADVLGWIKSRQIAWAKSQGLPDHVARRAA